MSKDTPTPVPAASERMTDERLAEIRALNAQEELSQSDVTDLCDALVDERRKMSLAELSIKDSVNRANSLERELAETKQAEELARWEFNSRANMQYAAQNLTDRILKLQAFKDYVHQRLDEAGIPKEPNGEHSKAGCRVGDRLDIALALSARAEAAEARAERARAALEKIEGMSVPDQPAAFALSRETYLMRWVAKLRGVARDALLTAPPTGEKNARP